MAVRGDESGTRPLNATGLIGPADTSDASVMVSTTTPRPGEIARTAGTVNGTALVAAAAEADRDGSADRFEIYETTLPDGQRQWMRRNLETGVSEKVDAEVSKQDRAARVDRAAAEAAEAAQRVSEAANAAAQRATRAAQRAADEAQRLAAGVDESRGA